MLLPSSPDCIIWLGPSQPEALLPSQSVPLDSGLAIAKAALCPAYSRSAAACRGADQQALPGAVVGN